MCVTITCRRNEIWWADMGGNRGCEQGGRRPVLILQNDVGNQFSPTVIVATISHAKRSDLPTHVVIGADHGMNKNSVIMLEQIRTIDKSRLRTCQTKLTNEEMIAVDQALQISLGLKPAKEWRNGA